MRAFLYALLTQAIVWLGRAREGLMFYHPHRVLASRTFFASNDEYSVCCDCGLEHRFLPLDGDKERRPSFRMRPKRPVGYAYRPRIFADDPRPDADESSG